MKKKTSPLLQPNLFNLDAPPVKLVDFLPVVEKKEPLSVKPSEETGLPLLPTPAVSPPQIETPERSENVPGEYAYKSRGVPLGDRMSPTYIPPTRRETRPNEPVHPETTKPLPCPDLPLPKSDQPPVLLTALAGAGEPGDLVVVQPERQGAGAPVSHPPRASHPHWWHWVKPKPPLKVLMTNKKGKTEEILIQPRGQYPYTPSLAVRRRSIPTIACSLYYSAWGCYFAKDAFDNSPPNRMGYVKVNKVCYEADTAKVERLISLLVFCEVPEDLARGLAREAWQDAKEGIYRRWSDRGEHLGIGRFKIEQLGYELGEKEDDGYGDTEAAAFVEFAVKEGVKGR